jgi:hypothetical protein
MAQEYVERIAVTITEAKRLELHQDLRNTIGVEAADTLMEHLPPTGWADVARRSDLDNQTAVAAGEFALVRSEMSAEFTAVRSEMAAEFAAVRNEMATEFAAVRNEMTTEFAAVRHEMAAEFAAVRHEMAAEFAAVRNEMTTEFTAIRNEMATEFAAVRSELTLAISEMKGHIDNRLAAQTRWIVTLTSANTLAMAGLIVAVLLKL